MNTIPGYFKYFVILASLVLTCYILILGKALLSPIVTAFIIALLLLPVSAGLERIRVSRGISSLLSMLVMIAVLFGLFYFFSSQVGNITSDLNAIGERFNELIDQGHTWMENTFGIEQRQQSVYLQSSIRQFVQNSSSAVTTTLAATADFFTSFFLFLIALFFLLYYRRFFVSFLYKWFRPEVHPTVGETINKIVLVVRSYIVGLLTVILIVAILNSVGLMFMGIQHAIFFGALAAVLTIIPYIGILIGSLLPILFALVTKDSLWYPVGVALLFWFVQFLEGNFITPNIVGGKVSINPFAAIVALFLGGMIWGALGMILSIPILAIIKVICDVVEPLKPIGFLLDNPEHEEIKHSGNHRFRDYFKKKEQQAEV